jgi:hypothetical protein
LQPSDSAGLSEYFKQLPWISAFFSASWCL